MEPEQIVRQDFPTVRKGWDPDAVRSHLEQIAAQLPTRPASLADEATERIGEIVAAAEASAAEIEVDARRRAEAMVEEARAKAQAMLRLAEASIGDAEGALNRARNEAEEILARASTEAGERVAAAQAAVENLLGKAEELSGRVGLLGQSLVDDILEGADDVGSAIVGPGAEPAGAADVERAAQAGSVASSIEELIAQLRGPIDAEDVEPEPEPDAPGQGAVEPQGADPGAADRPMAEQAPNPAEVGGDAAHAVRLVAMNLALTGADRDAIAEQIRTEFGEVEGADELIGEVLVRAGRG